MPKPSKNKYAQKTMLKIGRPIVKADIAQLDEEFAKVHRPSN